MAAGQASERGARKATLGGAGNHQARETAVHVRVHSVKTTPQMTRFRDAKVCNNWLQIRIEDHRIQSDYKYKSELQNPEGKKSVLGITSAW